MFSSIAYAMGPQPGAGAEGGMGQMLGTFGPFLIIIVVFYFFMIRPQKKRANEHQQMLASLKKGDPVMTNGGFYGRIVEFLDDPQQVVVDLGSFEVVINRSALSLVPSNQKHPVPPKKSKKKGSRKEEAVEAEADSDEDSSEE